ncbi:MAG: sugar ABC transporter ATP-binding protein [Planctomycetota bacterium]|nr:sugar ABC transporter ATP-binding protein [Planctomycetota bacterium]
MPTIGANHPLLVMEDIVKGFGGNLAVNHVTISVRAGRVVALLGENGAGKSTLIKILAGVYDRDSGNIFLDNAPIGSAADFSRGAKAAIAFIHQDLGLIDWMTAAENMAFVMGFPSSWGLIRWDDIRGRASRALAAVGLDIDPDVRVFELSRTEKSLLAIARAVSVKARVLVLDEPTASLPAADVKRLFAVLNRLKADGVGMIYVTHRLDEVMEIADDVVVMRDGFKVADIERRECEVGDLVRLIVGKDKGGDMRHPQSLREEPALRAEGLVIGDAGPVSFELRKGEMLALAGLRGAGQEEMGRALFGLRSIDAGCVALADGRAFRPRSPVDAIARGVNLLAGDRMVESLVMSISVRENMFINPVAQGQRPLSLFRPSRESRRGLAMARDFDIRPPAVDIDISALSGGNQQKVALARWLNVPGDVLILEDPTAGVDVGARADIYQLIGRAMDRGMAILLISSDFEEVAKICSRALVFNRGAVAAELRDGGVSFANLLKCASASDAGRAAGGGRKA